MHWFHDDHKAVYSELLNRYKSGSDNLAKDGIFISGTSDKPVYWFETFKGNLGEPISIYFFDDNYNVDKIDSVYAIPKDAKLVLTRSGKDKSCDLTYEPNRHIYTYVESFTPTLKHNIDSLMSFYDLNGKKIIVEVGNGVLGDIGKDFILKEIRISNNQGISLKIDLTQLKLNQNRITPAKGMYYGTCKLIS